MSEHAPNNWNEANQRYLMAALSVVREALERHIARSKNGRELEPRTAPTQVESAAQRALKEAAAAMPAPAALELMSTMFGLSGFERDLLLLCAGVELDSSFATVCAEAQGDPAHPFPTFSLALAALPEAHWSALTPAAPLRRWRLIEIGNGPALTLSQLRIDERILHYLAGVEHTDERLAGLIEHLAEGSELAASHHALAERIARLWSQPDNSGSSSGGGPLPLVQLCGDEVADKRAISVAACAAMGLRVASISARAIPTGLSELDGFIRLWGREAVLSNCALLVECHELEASDAARAVALNRLIESLNSPLIISGVERRRAWHKSILTFDVGKPPAREQSEIWQHALSAIPVNLNGQVQALVSQFNLNLQKVHAARAEAMARRASSEDADAGSAAADLGAALWDACRMQARPRLDDLAQRIEPAATWAELVLPEVQYQTLREIAAHVRNRMTVYDTWGFAAKGARGLGISALFSGVSGTGKTMAAEVLANELRLDLYRIDLSAVVSKYIGETEKNLRRVFDAAEEGGAILLFDEADALFGKRSEVRDSHDRYANIEVSYLLQRMEAYRGLAILTTNLKSALDTAFLRRIRFIVHFPFPDAAQRAEIWRRIFPRETPTRNLDADKLAQLNVAGGNIRNVALNAAFLAADAGQPVRMSHLLRAAQSEYAKLEKSLTEAEIRGWV
ncbi:MAG TPA: ATP-binding protein [Pyrinomonadaceae bacterium]|nr:ATP-binding protein [Pyrinomonadaceae bacterium]